MLDNEPDNTPDQPAETAAPPPRRRRAASRPAGPPSPAPDAPPIVTQAEPVAAEPAALFEPPVAADPPPAADPPAAAEPLAPAEPTPAPEPVAPVETAADHTVATPIESEALTEAPPAKKVAKRAPRKTAVKKTAAEKTAAAEPVEGEVKRTPRKRTAKKTAAAPPAAEESVDEVVSEVAVALQALASSVSANQPAVEAEEPDATLPATDLAAIAEPESSDQPTETPEAVPTDEPTSDDDHVELPDPVDADADVLTENLASEDAATDDSDEDADEPESELDDSEGESEGEGDGEQRRRRRRRGGRRRRRSGSDDEPATAAEESSDTEDESTSDDSESPAGEDADSADADGGDADGGDGSRRRRRRRRRRGEDAGTAPDDPTEVVVRVREPRSRAAKSSNEVTGIEGSTRMEAKRQRRREGREAGRRRAPILSEAEFLARREAVARKMIIRQRDDLVQIAVLEDEILVEHYVDRESAASLIGNVYLGRVQNVLPSMEAAFIDIGRGRNAVLYAGEVDWDSFGAEGQNRKVEKVLKSGQPILVQVTKDPVGAKGARLTNHVSIPGRYIVYAPGGHLSGISRKLPDTERRRLKDILSDLVGESASVIVRTAAEGASEDELVRDVNRLKAQWEVIEKKVTAGQAPQLLYGEPDLTVRIVRDLFTEDFAELIIQGNGGLTDAYDSIDGYVSHVAPHLAERMRRWDADAEGDLFGAYRLDEQIAKGLERKVFLPSGGSLVIDRTEAMTVIDVNTGKFTGAGGNLEATVTSNNLEAAEEIVRQLRLRDIGGIIVIDFIDMVLPNNRELLLRRLVECLGRDRTRHQVAEVTSLGLVQMTRKKIGTGLLEAFSSECPHCHGRGYEVHELPVETQKQADGGARDSRNNNNNGNNNGGNNNGGNNSRDRRGGRNNNRRGNDKSEDSSASEAPAADTPAPAAPAAESTEPVVAG